MNNIKWKVSPKNLSTLLFGLILSALSLGALATETDRTREKLEAAVSSKYRSDESKSRDGNRNPIKTLEFFGLKDDMRVLELFPGGGWYTEILAPVLAEQGELNLWFYAEDTAKAMKKRKGFKKAAKNLKVLPFDPESITYKGPYYHNQYPITVPEINFGTQGLDMVLNIWTMHLFTPEGRNALNKAAFDALEEGGVYGIVAHTRRHMEKDYYENYRRLDPVLVIKEVQDAGFEFVDFSDLHYRRDDELVYELGRKTVRGNTDRFTFKFRKPFSK